MKTKIILLILLAANFSCGTKMTLSDAKKDTIKGEVKAVVDSIFKGAEEANFEKITEPWLDSPDFLILINGRTVNYQQAMAMKPAFNRILNQKGTVLDEKYTFIDNSTAIYTANCKWIVNYKDGHSIHEDPEAFMFMFKKINNRWRVIYYADSYFERNVAGEGLKGLDQDKLHKQFIGNWKAELAKDTMVLWNIKSYGKGMEGNYRHISKGKTLMVGKQLWGNVEDVDNFILSEITEGNNKNGIYSTRFISENKCEMQSSGSFRNPSITNKKWVMEIKTPDRIEVTCFQNMRPIGTYTLSRVMQ